MPAKADCRLKRRFAPRNSVFAKVTFVFFIRHKVSCLTVRGLLGFAGEFKAVPKTFKAQNNGFNPNFWPVSDFIHKLVTEISINLGHNFIFCIP